MKKPTIADKLQSTPKTDELTAHIKSSNWKDWKNLELMTEHAQELEMKLNRLRYRHRSRITSTETNRDITNELREAGEALQALIPTE